MLTMSLCLLLIGVAAVIGLVAVALFSVPLMVVLSLAPFALRVAGLIALIKALFQKPLRLESFLPGIGMFVLAALIHWIF